MDYNLVEQHLVKAKVVEVVTSKIIHQKYTEEKVNIYFPYYEEMNISINIDGYIQKHRALYK